MYIYYGGGLKTSLLMGWVCTLVYVCNIYIYIYTYDIINWGLKT